LFHNLVPGLAYHVVAEAKETATALHKPQPRRRTTDGASDDDYNSGTAVERRAKVLRVFRMFDTDHSGDIDLDEFIGLVRQLGKDISPKELEAIFIDMDTDGNERIDFREFYRWWQDPKKQSTPNHGRLSRLLGTLLRSRSPPGFHAIK
jgi:hypothetical protein